MGERSTCVENRNYHWGKQNSKQDTRDDCQSKTGNDPEDTYELQRPQSHKKCQKGKSGKRKNNLKRKTKTLGNTKLAVCARIIMT